jgi:hypothetical protein
MINKDIFSVLIQTIIIIGKDLFMKQLLKPLGFLIILILFCSVASHLLTRGETLEEYAQGNPEIAYATPDLTPTPSPTAEPAPSPVPTPTASPLSTKETTQDTGNGQDILNQFYYEPLPEEIIARITGISYPVTKDTSAGLAVPAVNMVDSEEMIAVSYDELRYLKVLYYDFNGEVQTGELICNKGIAQRISY